MMAPEELRLSRTLFLVVLAILLVLPASSTTANAQSVALTAGLGSACYGSEGSVRSNGSRTVIGTAGTPVTPRLVVGLRVSRFETASADETSYYDGPEPLEVARVRHEIGRTVKYGVELVYYPAAFADERVSGFVGGGVGMRTFRHHATCAFGACHEPGPYAAVLRAGRGRRGYIGFVTGLDVALAYSLLARAAIRLDDFPSESGTAQATVEMGFRFRKR